MLGTVLMSIVPNEHEDQSDLENAHFPWIDTIHIECDNLKLPINDSEYKFQCPTPAATLKVELQLNGPKHGGRL
uniref:Uncharacterized protein n=1 Tax=Arundo donax TaxID=35708 RepID=A0A0A9DUC2_ARUDO